MVYMAFYKVIVDSIRMDDSVVCDLTLTITVLFNSVARFRILDVLI